VPDTLYQQFKDHGYDFFVGVPCSTLKAFCAALAADPAVTFIPATREDIALAIAVGAYLAGRKPLVYIQSAGLGHCVNVITTLIRAYEMPDIHLLISHRTRPFEHEFMGRITEDLLRLLDYKQYTLVPQP
jgi:phosphonopyruvate decarboxylase